MKSLNFKQVKESKRWEKYEAKSDSFDESWEVAVVRTKKNDGWNLHITLTIFGVEFKSTRCFEDIENRGDNLKYVMSIASDFIAGIKIISGNNIVS